MGPFITSLTLAALSEALAERKSIQPGVSEAPLTNVLNLLGLKEDDYDRQIAAETILRLKAIHWNNLLNSTRQDGRLSVS